MLPEKTLLKALYFFKEWTEILIELGETDFITIDNMDFAGYTANAMQQVGKFGEKCFP